MLGWDRTVGNMLEQMGPFLALFWSNMLLSPYGGLSHKYVAAAGWLYVLLRSLYPVSFFIRSNLAGRELNIMRTLTLALALLIFLPADSSAQRSDRPGSSDYPLVSRFEGATIDKYEEVQFDRYELPLGPAAGAKDLGDVLTLEGKITKINYAFWEEPKPSLYQLYKSYEKVFNEKGVEFLFACFEEECRQEGADLVRTAADLKMLLNGFMAFGEHAYIAARAKQGSQEIYIGLYLKQERSNLAYELHFIEVEAMSADKISMADISKGMEETGKQAFYGLYFETGSATLKDSSQDELALLAGYLKTNSGASYFIVGHTDNVGQYAANKFLAKARAASVVDALDTRFQLDTSNLTAIGIGPVSPIASNSTEAGRAQNRRVELVLK
ncbi:MAG: OmpA family protein [Pseudomonadota bacterium]